MDNLSQSLIHFLHQQPMVPDHGTQYEENTFRHHGEIHEDGHSDEQMNRHMVRLDPFLYSL